MFIKAVIYKSLVKRIIPVPYEQPLGMKRDWTDGTNECRSQLYVYILLVLTHIFRFLNGYFLKYFALNTLSLKD